MKILGIVPARGGSKGVPRKNIRPIAGKPLIAYTILAGRSSRYIDRLIVSTDDEEILEVSRQYEAEVPFVRPSELAGDEVTDLPVFEHCLNWLATNEGYHPDIVVHLRPTAPLRTAKHIDEAIDLLLNPPDADSVRSVCRAPQHPFKMWRINHGWLTPFINDPIDDTNEPYNLPRQQLPECYVQNGAVDVVRTPVITEHRSMTGRLIKPYVMGETTSVNIDSPLDWALAERLLGRSR